MVIHSKDLIRETQLRRRKMIYLMISDGKVMVGAFLEFSTWKMSSDQDSGKFPFIKPQQMSM